MFGLGYTEIALLLVLLVLLFGGRSTGRMLGKAFGLYRDVEDTRSELRRQFSLSSLLHRDRK